MASLGELFVELGVVGDVKPLEKAVGTMKEAVKQIDKEIAANKRLLRYKNDLAKATSESEKKIIKENFVKEIQKEKTLDEINSTQKVINGKQELAGKISSLVTGIGVFVGALAGAAFALNRLTNELVQSNQAMLNLTRTTDIAQSTFQKWGGIGKLLGVEDADQQLAGLNERLFDLMLTGQGARGFQLAGVNPIGQDANGVLEQLRARISGMNDTAASYLLQQMGLDPKMLHLLRMSRAEFEALGQTIQKYQLTPEQSHQIQQMNMQLQIAGLKLKYLKDRAILAIMPYWVKFVESLASVTEFLIKVATWVNKNIKVWLMLFGVIAKGQVTFTKFGNFFRGLLQVFNTLIARIPIFGAAVTRLGSIFARAFLPLTAAYLVLDDLATYFEGGDSLTGRVINWMQDTGTNFSNIFGQMMGGDISGGLGAFGNQILDTLLSIESSISRVLEILVNFLSFGAFDKLKNSKFWQFLMPTPETVLENVNNVLGKPTGGAAGVNGVLPDLSRDTLNSVKSNTNNSSMVNSNNTNTNKISQNIEIYTNQPASDIDRQLRYASRVFAV